MRPLALSTVPLFLLLSAVLAACAGPSSAAEHAAVALPKPLVDLPAPPAAGPQTAVLAGGCFWCEESAFEQLKGVTSVVAGYAGGTEATATYEKYHESNHAEAIRITYDPAQITYGELLRVLFTAGDPTTKDGQEPDFGRQYRIAVFYETEDQQRVAQAYIRQLAEAKLFAKPIAATVEAMPHGFFAAEDFHQRYVVKHPDHPYVKRWSLPKIAKVRAAFADEVKPADETPPKK
ncbi:MAG: peptide-methionine (S)-S-oxide reductase MsrA [Planctomycetes bacterium]|nr:peptide-methionine (S)-S-oxide reductase MsrA [Planctomycetota bacterium]